MENKNYYDWNNVQKYETVCDAMKTFYMKYGDIDMDVTTTFVDHEYIIHLSYSPPELYRDEMYYGYSVKMQVSHDCDPDFLYDMLVACRGDLIKMYKSRKEKNNES